MEARMKNPAMVLSDAMKGIPHLHKAMHQGGVSQEILELVHMRVSQINACGPCVDSGGKAMKKLGMSDQRMWSVAAWRESPYFTDAERAALALAEAATRLADRPDPVSQEIWDDAADHFDEKGLSAIILMIATTNFYNTINATIKEQAGANWN